jgi:alkanesulfonate monooxygenase SsuD/methylene tetrahydromethanopterin reductase-like flavin-dependent oxidoreductase (luciferase family)
MKLGLHVPAFTWPNGPAAIPTDLTRIAHAAEEGGFDRLSVMALVTGVVYRDPGLLAKMVTTLDVLSGGRAMLGIGAAWNDEEAAGLGLFFPPTAERFERLEEALQICRQMWSDSDAPYVGTHYRLGRTLNVPQAVSRPHPPILIGGSGERKTLRLVAKYAQACNLFGAPEVGHKLDVLREHCEREGRDYDEIEKTVIVRFDVGPHGERVGQTIDELATLAAHGFTVAHGSLVGDDPMHALDVLATRVIPAIAEF